MIAKASSYERRNERQRQIMAANAALAKDIPSLPRIVSPKRRSLCLADPFRFARTYWPDIFYNPWAPYHKEIIEAICESVQFGTKKAIAAPRGEGKTSIAIAMEIWAMLKGYHDFAVILGATDAKAAQIMKNAKKMLTADRFIEDFPEVGYPLKLLGGEPRKANGQTYQGMPTEVNWTSEHIQLPRIDGSACSGGLFMPLSMDGAIRGVNVEGRRPKHGIADDPETRESAENEEIVKHRLTVIEEDFLGLGGQDGFFGVVANVTIMNNFCLAAKLTDRKIKPAWGGLRFGLIDTWPTNKHLWDQYIEIRKACQEAGDAFAWEATLFYLRRFKEMNEGCRMNNNNRFKDMLSPKGNPIEVSALQHCMNMIADVEDIKSFLCEYQNDTKAFNVDTDTTEKILTAKVVEKRVNHFDQGELHEDAIGITAAVDVGRRMSYWTKIAWLPGNRGMIIDYGVIESHSRNEASQVKAIKASIADWHDYQSSSTTPPSMVLLDTSDGPLTDDLYDLIHELPDYPPIVPSKGYGRGQGPKPIEHVPEAERSELILGSHWYGKFQPRKDIWLYHPDANYWKRFVQLAFEEEPFNEKGEQRENTLTLYKPSHIRAHQSFSHHICAEEWKFKGKQDRFKQFVLKSPNNHWLDATYMACVAASMEQFIATKDAAVLVN